MFCADYVAAFVYHAFFTIGSVNLVGKEVRQEDSSDHDVDDDLSRWCSEMMIIIFFLDHDTEEANDDPTKEG